MYFVSLRQQFQLYRRFSVNITIANLRAGLSSLSSRSLVAARRARTFSNSDFRKNIRVSMDSGCKLLNIWTDHK